MNALVFLGIAVVLSAAGCLVLWLRSRQPGSMDAHIRDFARELDALAPGSPLDRPRGRPGARDDGADQPRRDEPGPQWPPNRRGPERPWERGTRPERPSERGTGPERPSGQGTGGRPPG